MKSAKDEWKAGWPVVLAAVIAMAIPSFNSYTIGIFAPALMHEYGWSLTQATFPVMATSVIGALLAPFLGAAMDRFGARAIGLVGTVLALVGFLAVPIFVTADYTSYVGTWIVSATLLQAAGMMTWMMGVAKRFESQRGLAIAIAMGGTSLMGGLAAPIARLMVDAHGWKLAFAGMGSVICAVSFVTAYFLFRDRPDLPQVATARQARATAADAGPTSGMTFSQAWRTLRFWQFALCLLLTGMGVVGVLVHFPSIFVEKGLSPLAAASMVSVAAATSFISRITTGALLDRLFGPHLAVIVFVSATLALLLLILAPFSLAIGLTAAVLFGVVVGGEVDIATYLVARYFGMREFGRIYGVLFGIFICGQGVAPLLIGWSVDHWHSYVPALSFLAAGFVAGAILVLMLGSYPPSDQGERIASLH